MHRGLINLAQENKASALNDLEKAHRQKPHIKEIWNLLLSLKIEFEEIEDAIALAEKFIKIEPSNEKNFANIALCYQHLKNYNKAVIFYKKATEINPAYVEAWINLGLAFKSKGMLDKAIEAVNKAISLEPNHAEAYANRALIKMREKDILGALKDSEMTVSLKPHLTQVWFLLGS